jgi:TRAP-type C4-dicarboxylate transport system substrate-binding protein
MLSQVRAGGIELLAAPSLTLSTLVPLSGLPSIGFAFQSYDEVWAAMDGGVGDLVREAIGKAGILPMKKIWEGMIPGRSAALAKRCAAEPRP